MSASDLDPVQSAPAAPSASPGRKPRRGDLLETRLEKIDRRGGVRGRASHASGEYSVRVRRGVPGQLVLAEVVSRRGARIEARTLAERESSPLATTPRCPHFGTCGGCSFQDLVYAAQLDEKRRWIEDELRSAGLLARAGAPAIEPCIACEDPWRYRNKMDFTFSTRRWLEPHERRDGASEDDARSLALGLHPSGWHSKVLDVRECSIQFAEGDKILASARELALEHSLDAWDLDRHAGLLRHLVLRKSWSRGEILANLVTSEEAPERVRPYAAALLARHPEITTLVQNVTARLAAIAVGERELVLHGDGTIREELGGLVFVISANSFFQTNTPQAARLFRVVREAAGAGPGDVVHDLYCGAGTIALSLARDAREVWGFELVDAALADARRNALANGTANARFVGGDVASSLASSAAPAPDVVVVDPPRAGLHPSVVETLRAMRFRRLVYVSCNARTAAADVVGLTRESANSALELTRVQPLDLFPHTPHLECVLTLERST